MVAVDVADTAAPVTVKVAELLPDGTVTLLTETVATAVLLLATLTTTPPAGAVAFNVTVAVDVVSPVMVVGFKVSDEIAGGSTVSAAVCCTLFSVAETVATVCAPTLTDVTVNVAELAPPATVTLAGTVAAAELLDNVTTAPPAGAVPVRVTVAVGFVKPPCTVVTLSDSDATPRTRTAVAVKFTPVIFALLTVSAAFAGLKVKPDFDGVTV
jgi:hypothetical protein